MLRRQSRNAAVVVLAMLIVSAALLADPCDEQPADIECPLQAGVTKTMCVGRAEADCAPTDPPNPQIEPQSDLFGCEPVPPGKKIGCRDGETEGVCYRKAPCIWKPDVGTDGQCQPDLSKVTTVSQKLKVCRPECRDCIPTTPEAP